MANVEVSSNMTLPFSVTLSPSSLSSLSSSLFLLVCSFLSSSSLSLSRCCFSSSRACSVLPRLLSFCSSLFLSLSLFLLVLLSSFSPLLSLSVLAYLAIGSIATVFATPRLALAVPAHGAHAPQGHLCQSPRKWPDEVYVPHDSWQTSPGGYQYATPTCLRPGTYFPFPSGR